MARALTLAVLLRVGASVVPECAVKDLGYLDSNVPIVNGGIEVADAQTCQHSCEFMPGCKGFTYYINSGGCWLQGMLGELPLVKEIAGVYSGPPVCLKNSTEGGEAEKVTAAGGIALMSWAPMAIELPTLPPMPTFAPYNASAAAAAVADAAAATLAEATQRAEAAAAAAAAAAASAAKDAEATAAAVAAAAEKAAKRAEVNAAATAAAVANATQQAEATAAAAAATVASAAKDAEATAAAAAAEAQKTTEAAAAGAAASAAAIANTTEQAVATAAATAAAAADATEQAAMETAKATRTAAAATIANSTEQVEAATAGSASVAASATEQLGPAAADSTVAAASATEQATAEAAADAATAISKGSVSPAGEAGTSKDIVPGNASEANATVITGDVSKESQGGGFPAWAGILIAAVCLGGAMTAGYMYLAAAKGAPKKKRTSERKTRRADIEASEQGGEALAPLMLIGPSPAASMPMPARAPYAGVARAAPLAPQYMAGPVRAPPVQMAPPMAYAPQLAYGHPVQRVIQEPMAAAVAGRQASQQQSLFDRLDTSHDGVLSRAEFSRLVK